MFLFMLILLTKADDNTIFMFNTLSDEKKEILLTFLRKLLKQNFDDDFNIELNIFKTHIEKLKKLYTFGMRNSLFKDEFKNDKIYSQLFANSKDIDDFYIWQIHWIESILYLCDKISVTLCAIK